jgi:hypothetical protein
MADSLAAGKIDQATHDTLLEHFQEEDPDDPIPWCGGGGASVELSLASILCAPARLSILRGRVRCGGGRAGSPPCTGDQEQLAWIEKVLMASDADWKVKGPVCLQNRLVANRHQPCDSRGAESDRPSQIVMGHFPIYSATTHEHGETAKLVEILDPILHKVSLRAAALPRALETTLRLSILRGARRPRPTCTSAGTTTSCSTRSAVA